VACVLIFGDVTERRRSEQAMARSERELTDLQLLSSLPAPEPR
jgi:hypothetical protein